MNLSVIIPVYNVEHTLDRCVESVLGQKVQGMEVILVDDGSTDASGRLCDEWAGRDSRVCVVHQPNRGLSAARNTGLDMATGKYMAFADSDDYVMPDTYLSLIELLDRHDNVGMLEFGIRHEGAGRMPLELDDAIYADTRDYWLKTMVWNHAYVWNKIFRAEVFRSVRFTEGRLYEDLLILPELLRNIASVATVSRVGYVYCDSVGSISNTLSVNSLIQLLRAEVHAVFSMCTLPWQDNAMNLYRAIGCRVYDIIRVGVFEVKL